MSGELGTASTIDQRHQDVHDGRLPFPSNQPIPVCIGPRAPAHNHMTGSVCNNSLINSSNLVLIKPITTFTKLCVLNTRSIRNKVTDFVDFVTEKDVDIVAISETWLKDGDDVIIRSITPTGYQFVQQPREGKTGGGVGLLFKSSLSVTVYHTSSSKSFESLHAQVSDNSRSFRLVVIYRPDLDMDGHHVPFSLFRDEFSNLLDAYHLHPSELIMAGDFNIWVDVQEDPKTKQFLELLCMA